MKQIEVALKHIKLLYYVFIVVLVVNIGYDFYSYDMEDAVQGFKEGYAEGRTHVGDDGKLSDVSRKFIDARVYGAFLTTLNREKTVDVIIDNDSMKLSVNAHSFDATLEKTGNSDKSWGVVILKWILNIVAFVSIILTFILTIRLITNLGRSIVKKDIFNEKTIRICRWFALMVAIWSVSFGLLTFVDEMIMADYLIGTKWEFIPAFPINMSWMTTATMIYMFSEILKIGNILKQEQELTI